MSEHIPSGFSMATISSFRRTENTHDVYKGKGCMKKFCEFLREHAMKIIFKKYEILTKKQQESYESAKICYICRKNLKINV